MLRGRENRAKVIANVHRLLKPRGRFVLHVHNRNYVGLGWGRIFWQAAKSVVGQAGDVTMPQAYGGAPLTLHHFTRRECRRLLEENGFSVREVMALGADGKNERSLWRTYGWLMVCERKM